MKPGIAWGPQAPFQGKSTLAQSLNHLLHHHHSHHPHHDKTEHGPTCHRQNWTGPKSERNPDPKPSCGRYFSELSELVMFLSGHITTWLSFPMWCYTVCILLRVRYFLGFLLPVPSVLCLRVTLPIRALLTSVSPTHWLSCEIFHTCFLVYCLPLCAGRKAWGEPTTGSEKLPGKREGSDWNETSGSTSVV